MDLLETLFVGNVHLVVFFCNMVVLNVFEEEFNVPKVCLWIQSLSFHKIKTEAFKNLFFLNVSQTLTECISALCCLMRTGVMTESNIHLKDFYSHIRTRK